MEAQRRLSMSEIKRRGRPRNDESPKTKDADRVIGLSVHKGGSSRQIGSSDHEALAIELLRRLASDGKA